MIDNYRFHKSDGSNRITAMDLLHAINHTHTNRVCNLSTSHVVDESLSGSFTIDDDHHVFYDVPPGLYEAIIEGESYIFDLYVTVAFSNMLIINSPFDAYALNGLNKYYLNLYKVTGSNTGGDTTLQHTLNTHLNMIAIDGKTTRAAASVEPTTPSPVSSISSFKILTSKTTSMPKAEDSDPNDIYDSDPDPKDYLEIFLKNNIKSLPNGVRDTFILNGIQEQHHIVFRVGRERWIGSENWVHVADVSNDKSYVLFNSSDNVKIENSSTNIITNYFNTLSSTELLNKSCTKNGICCATTELGSGFYVRVSVDVIEYNREDQAVPFRRWLASLQETQPMIVEYALKEYLYRTVYLDEYHVATFFDKTTVHVDNDLDISYFYNTCG